MGRLGEESIVREAMGLIEAGGATQAVAVSVAVHLENALGVTVPDRFITAEHLGSPDAIVRVLASIECSR